MIWLVITLWLQSFYNQIYDNFTYIYWALRLIYILSNDTDSHYNVEFLSWFKLYPQF